MGRYDGPEVCELPGLSMLNELSKKFDKDNIVLYRDDRLSVFKNHNGHQNDKVRKKMIDLFKQHHLNLEIKCNLKTAITSIYHLIYLQDCLNHTIRPAIFLTIRPAIFLDMLMQNQIIRHLY